MKRTGPGVLALAAVLGAVAGYVIDTVLTQTGNPTFTPEWSLPLMLLALALITFALAWPIRRAVRGASGARPVDPFRSLRVATLAKASSIVGAAVGGVGVGLAAFLLTRPVTPPLGSMGTIIATVVCAAALVAAALIAEHFCTLPKDDDDQHPGPESGSDPAGDPGAGFSHH